MESNSEITAPPMPKRSEKIASDVRSSPDPLKAALGLTPITAHKTWNATIMTSITAKFVTPRRQILFMAHLVYHNSAIRAGGAQLVAPAYFARSGARSASAS